MNLTLTDNSLHRTKGKILEDYLDIRGENNHRESGIYAIINKINDKKYIGQSKNIRLRWRGHLNDLRKNIHRSTYLNYAINKYGLNHFYFTVIENCEVRNLEKREKYWITKLKVDYAEFGYNKTMKQAEYAKHYNSLDINYRKDPDYWWLDERNEQYQEYSRKVKAVIRLYRDGLEMDEIAEKLNVSSIERIAYNKNWLSINDRRCRINVYNRSMNIRKNQIELLLRMKMTKTEVAKRLGISLRGLNSYINRKNVGYDSEIGKSKVRKFIYKPLSKKEIQYYRYRDEEPYLIKKYIFENPHLTAKEVGEIFKRHRDYIGEFIYGKQHDNILPELNNVVKNRKKTLDLRKYRIVIQFYRSGYSNQKIMKVLQLNHLSTLVRFLERTLTIHDKRCRLNSINRANRRNKYIYNMFIKNLTNQQIMNKLNISEHEVKEMRKSRWCKDIIELDDINNKSLPKSIL